MCYLNRTYHVLPTLVSSLVDIWNMKGYPVCDFSEGRVRLTASHPRGLPPADFPIDNSGSRVNVDAHSEGFLRAACIGRLARILHWRTSNLT
jgi:hypothetical protein